MDVDHRKLVDLFNSLGESISNREGKDACLRTLDEIIQLGKANFELEDELMVIRRYPKAESHTAKHAAMIERAVIYRTNLDPDSPEAYMGLVYFAEVWLCYHIIFFDKELARFIAQTT